MRVIATMAAGLLVAGGCTVSSDEKNPGQPTASSAGSADGDASAEGGGSSSGGDDATGAGNPTSSDGGVEDGSTGEASAGDAAGDTTGTDGGTGAGTGGTTSPPGDGEIYGECMTTDDCDPPLYCVPGYSFCSHDCDSAGDCEAAPSGNIDPICDFGSCQLYCDAAGAQCPSGMTCLDWICVYP